MKLERIRIRFFIFFAVILGTALRGYSQITDLYINELQASSDSLISNPFTGGYTDWFELYYAGTTEVDISGFYLTDDPDRNHTTPDAVTALCDNINSNGPA